MTIDKITNKKRPARILLIDDNNGDVLLSKRAFKLAKNPIELDAVQNGEEALAKLLGKEGFINDFTPDLILLDLNLPKMNGLQILNRIKSADSIKHIPVIILSGSRLDRGVVKSYDFYANCFLQKPFNLEGYKELIEKIESFWLDLALLPDDRDVCHVHNKSH